MDVIARLQAKNAGDSRLLKALTALATLYLPASLTAVSRLEMELKGVDSQSDNL